MEAININDFNNHKIKESTVVKRILAGEKELFEILVRRNNQKLYRIIRSYINDESEIKDLMQDTYIKAFTKLYQFRLESTFSTWLIRIGINESLVRIKEKNKVKSLNMQNHNNTILEIPDTKQLNPQDKMIRSETKQLFDIAIDSLDSKYRIVYIMKVVEEMSLKEISESLELSIANVKIRLYRSKEMLKNKLYETVNEKNIYKFGYSKCDSITEQVMLLI